LIGSIRVTENARWNDRHADRTRSLFRLARRRWPV
jgi:hypothetical protein